jgi:pimeloyl-ACP methyl ester carboxylesterase
MRIFPTKPGWPRLKSALRHALARPEVDARRVLLIGMSEGAPMAAGLARALPEVTDVALVGATGTTQLFDFAAGIYARATATRTSSKRLQELDQTFNAIAPIREHQQILGAYLSALEQLLRPVDLRAPGAFACAGLPGQRHAGQGRAHRVDRSAVRATARAGQGRDLPPRARCRAWTGEGWLVA